MTANKRKRGREEQEEELEVNELEVQKPKKTQHNPPGIISAAVAKIAELEKYINQVAAEEEDGDSEADDDDDYNSDYSDLSASGRFDTNSTDSGGVNGNPVMIREDASFNPELVGFAICAQETMNFLRKEGFSEDNPLILNMQSRLLEQLNQYQSSLNGKSSRMKWRGGIN